ncbi:MAG: 16S rRNA (uracil(1498)-N(3))-methyltransferase [Elainella sp. Prado103]|jgi:16S rRNA (uracil1498-N3)-methyltransferase|nr:16S rRNA (uracil(1498)-N(3))-methyltransferase [Elainella sp. Prado103]
MAQLQRLTLDPAQILDRQISLTEPQQHYLYRVLRLRPGQQFIALDGQGQSWLATLQPDRSIALIAETGAAIEAATELAIPLTLLIALPKTGMDDIVRQATELGVQRIVPILSQRTLLQPSPQKLERWQRIAQEAAEQSERPIVPEIYSPQPWSEALTQWHSDQTASFICEARGHPPHLLTCLSRETRPTWTVAIGPEGGWTEDELTQAITIGYQAVSLGSRILRSITAPLVALSLMAGAIETLNIEILNIEILNNDA